MQLFLHTILISEAFVSEVKKPSHFSMLEVKLWHNKTETKNVKLAKMIEFIKTPNPRRFNFGNFFYSIILPTADPKMGNFLLPWVNDENLGERFP